VATYTHTPEVADGETATSEERRYLVTPVMQAFSDKIKAAVQAADDIAAQDKPSHEAKVAADEQKELIDAEKAKISDAATAAAEAATSEEVKVQLDAAMAADTAIDTAVAEIEKQRQAAGKALETATGLQEAASFDNAAKTLAEDKLSHI